MCGQQHALAAGWALGPVWTAQKILIHRDSIPGPSNLKRVAVLTMMSWPPHGGTKISVIMTTQAYLKCCCHLFQFVSATNAAIFWLQVCANIHNDGISRVSITQFQSFV